jgi:general secretion pathway protein D
MFRKMKIKTLATFTMLAFVVQPVLAQQAQPIEAGDLPVRTPMPFRGKIATDVAAPARSRNARGEDVSQVPLKKCVKKTGYFSFNEEKIQIADLVDKVSRLLCKNFIIASDVRGTTQISIISRTPIKVDEVWQVFNSALESNSFAIEKVGDFNKIVKVSNDLSKKVIPIYERGQNVSADDGTVTFIYAPRNIPMQNAQQLIGQLSKSTATQAGEYLVFSDSSLNIKRIEKILDRIDVAGAANQIHVVEPDWASATDLKKKIEEIFESKGASQNRMMNMGMGRMPATNESDSSQMKMVADERTNKLIIIASDKTYERVREMIDILDVAGSNASASTQINIYQLNNATAKDLATTLKALTQGAKPVQPGQTRSPFVPAATQEGQQFEGEIKVQEDEKTNSLLISASPRDFRTLSRVIAQLDKQRPQVFLEVVIMEITARDTLTLGLDVFAGISGLIPGALGIVGNAGGATLAGNVIQNYATALTQGTQQAQAAALGSFLGTLGVMGTSQIPIAGGTLPVPSFGAVLNLIDVFGTVDILAKPTLTTVDNQKATIEIGQRVPQSSGITSLAGAATTLGAVTNSITYQDVTNKLEITTHTNDNDEILMEIKQDISTLGDLVNIPGAGSQYAINKKKTDVNVRTKDQQTIVIGGLINRQKNHTETKTPWLGDIPLIGYLFKDTTDVLVDSNLVLVITPYIIRSPGDNLKVYQRKMKEQEDFSKMYFGDKIKKYDPHVDYDKKPGPIAKMLHEVDYEMSKVENGGAGLPGEVVIRSDRHESKDRDKKLDATLPEIPVGGTDDNNMPFQAPVPMPEAQPYVPPPAPEPVPPAQSAPAPNVQPPAGTPPPPNVIVPQQGGGEAMQMPGQVPQT